MTSEAKVGILFFLGLSLIVGFTLFVSKTGGSGDGFHIRFPSVAGLTTGSAVTYNGIPIGRVDTVRPKKVDGQVWVSIYFNVEEDYRDDLLLNDETRFVISQGMLGGASLVIKHEGAGESFSQKRLDRHVGEAPVTFTAALENFGTLVEENRETLRQALARMPDAVGNFADMSGEIKAMVAENRTTVKETMVGARDMTVGLASMVKENRAGVASMVTRIDAMAKEVQAMVAENRTNMQAAAAKLPTAVDNLSGAAGAIKTAVDDNRKNIDAMLTYLAQFAPKLAKIGDDMATITGQVRSGHGTIGRLVFQDDLHQKATAAVDSFGQRMEEVKPLTSGISDLKFYIGADGGMNVDSGASTATAYLRIEPKPWKFYEGGIGYRTAPDDRDTVDEDPEDLNIDLHLALGWRFLRDDDLQGYRLSVKGGLLEGSFGAQADYRLWRDRLSVSGMLRTKHNDFQELDRRYEDGDLMARAYLTYRVWERVFLHAGGTDLIDDPAPYLGIRGELLDNDIRNFTTASGLVP